MINFDQTGIKIVPTSGWTLEQKGAKQVTVTGLSDKREITEKHWSTSESMRRYAQNVIFFTVHLNSQPPYK